MKTEDQIRQHYDAKIQAIQSEIDATVQQMAGLDAAHNAAMSGLDALMAASKAHSRAATQKRQRLEKAFYEKYGYLP